jgi:nitrous oxide reductase accessory protein NosL
MKKTVQIVGAVTLALLAGCNTSKKEANEENFGAAINKALTTQGLMCLPATKWPTIANLRPGTSETTGMTSEGLAALENTGLARSTDTTQEIEISWGKTRKQQVKSYSLTEAAQAYLHDGGQLCWGQKIVDRIVSWSEPSNNQSSILYVYRISGVAAWANSDEIQNAFPSIKTDIAGAGRSQNHCVADFTKNGWQANCPLT